jgi:hypothetical protein
MRPEHILGSVKGDLFKLAHYRSIHQDQSDLDSARVYAEPTGKNRSENPDARARGSRSTMNTFPQRSCET